MRKLLYIFVAVLPFVSCRENFCLFEIDSFITDYYIPADTLTLTDLNARSFKEINMNYFSGKRDEAGFRQKRMENGDTVFRKVSGCPVLNGSCAESPAAIDVVCSRDFDAAHPAGTSLNDIVLFIGCDFYRCIKYSMYERGMWPDSISGWALPYLGNGGIPVVSWLSELDYGDIVQPDVSMLLRIYAKPDAPGEYPLTVTLVTSAGKRISGVMVLSYD